MLREQYFKTMTARPLNEDVEMWQWFKGAVDKAKGKIEELMRKFGGDEEGAILHAASLLGISKEELTRRARATISAPVTESKLDEVWLRDFVYWFRDRVVTAFRGLGNLFSERMTIITSIIGIISLGLVTSSSMPFIVKLLVWIYAWYIADKSGAKSEHLPED